LAGVRLSDMSSITHLLFVDDVLIFLNGSFQDSYAFKAILDLFCIATGMQPNIAKSTIIIVSCQLNEARLASQFFEYERQDLDDGLKYLGFRLKPNGYRIADWTWLIAKIESRINIWQQRWLSRVGRLTLLKSIR